MKHVIAKHTGCTIPSCCICEGGLASCDVCYGGEGSLTDTDCPGQPISPPEVEAVLLHNWDFKDGYWIKKKERGEQG